MGIGENVSPLYWVFCAVLIGLSLYFRAQTKRADFLESISSMTFARVVELLENPPSGGWDEEVKAALIQRGSETVSHHETATAQRMFDRHLRIFPGAREVERTERRVPQLREA